MRTVKRNSLFAQFIKSNPELFAFIKPGDLIEGILLEKSPREVIVDLGKYGTGIVYRGEFLNARDAIKKLQVGQSIQAKVLEVDNNEGLIELSLSEAEKQKSWLELEEFYEKEEVIIVRPLSANKGGLVAEVRGIKAFLPASQLSTEHYPNIEDNDRYKIEAELNKLIDKELHVKILDFNPRTNKLIISERAALELNAKELAKGYEVDQVVEGIVSGVADFGAFIKFTDNPNVEGLIHVSELDYRTIENPKEVINVDDVVEAKIIDIKDGKISLSLKALKQDPWKDVIKHYKENQEVKGSVYNFNPFGAIINLDKAIQGHIHITDFGGVEEMKKQLALGESYTFIIKGIKLEEQRIILSLKGLTKT